MGGGPTPATQVQQTRQSNEPPAYIQPYLQGGIQDLTRLYQAGSAPSYYPGRTVAGFSPQTQSALSALEARAAAGSPAVRAAQGNVADTAGGKYLDIASNPYFQKALAAGFEPQTQQFMTSVLPGVAAQFEGAGRYGSGQHRTSTGMALDSLNRAQAGAAATAANAAYGGERANQLAAAGLAPALAAADYTDLGAGLEAGRARDAQAQKEIDADIARYNYDTNNDWNYINRYLASLNAGYPGSESSGTVWGSAQPSYDPLARLLGIGQGFSSLFSDARLKEEVRPVGALDDGQTVYAYRYRGDPRTRLGLLAHEVERVHPEAVVRHPSGYRMVDYARATGFDVRPGRAPRPGPREGDFRKAGA